MNTNSHFNNCVIEAWQKHEPELRGFLTRRLNSPRLAEDLLHDTFVKALAEGAGFCELDNPRAWLYRVARNSMIDQMRRTRSIVELDENLPVEEIEIPGVENLSVCLPRALSELAPEDSEAIRLCDLEGLSQADYARKLGLSLAGAKSRVQRARRRLREHLKAHCQVQFDGAGQVCCFVPRESNSTLPSSS